MLEADKVAFSAACVEAVPIMLAPATAAAALPSRGPLLFLWGSQTGGAEMLAKSFAKNAKKLGFDARAVLVVIEESVVERERRPSSHLGQQLDILRREARAVVARRDADRAKGPAASREWDAHV